jgi:3-methyladenine DNA glycosylase Mpg
MYCRGGHISYLCKVSVLQSFIEISGQCPIYLNYAKGIEEGSFLYECADLILNRSQLICFRNKFRITEAELYVFQEGHFDPYAFGAEGKKAGDLQSKPGQWFEHGAALEYTFGEPGKFRGILIRGIEPIEGRGEKSASSWDTREQLLRLCNNDLRKNLKLEMAALEQKSIKFETRLQLDKKIDPKFADLPYRFSI